MCYGVNTFKNERLENHDYRDGYTKGLEIAKEDFKKLIRIEITLAHGKLESVERLEYLLKELSK